MRLIYLAILIGSCVENPSSKNQSAPPVVFANDAESNVWALFYQGYMAGAGGVSSAAQAADYGLTEYRQRQAKKR